MATRKIVRNKFRDTYQSPQQIRNARMNVFNTYKPSYDLFFCIDETFRNFNRKVGHAKVQSDMCTQNSIAVTYSCSFDIDKHKRYMDSIMFWYGYLFDYEDDSVDYGGSYATYIYRAADENELRRAYNKIHQLTDDEMYDIVRPDDRQNENLNTRRSRKVNEQTITQYDRNTIVEQIYDNSRQLIELGKNLDMCRVNDAHDIGYDFVQINEKLLERLHSLTRELPAQQKNNIIDIIENIRTYLEHASETMDEHDKNLEYTARQIKVIAKDLSNISYDATRKYSKVTGTIELPDRD